MSPTYHVNKYKRLSSIFVKGIIREINALELTILSFPDAIFYKLLFKNNIIISVKDIFNLKYANFL